MQLDRSRVKVVGELKKILIKLSSNPKIHETTDIVVANVPKSYGMWLSCDWYQKLKGYFVINWWHLWFPYQGKSNKIQIEREPYIKQIVTDLDDPSEPVFLMNFNSGNYSMDTFFGNLPVEIYPFS